MTAEYRGRIAARGQAQYGHWLLQSGAWQFSGLTGAGTDPLRMLAVSRLWVHTVAPQLLFFCSEKAATRVDLKARLVSAILLGFGQPPGIGWPGQLLARPGHPTALQHLRTELWPQTL